LGDELSYDPLLLEPILASIQQRGGRYQVRVVHRLLPRPYFNTFDTRDAAVTCGDELEAMLALGQVPPQLLERPALDRGDRTQVADMLDTYSSKSTPSAADIDTMKVLRVEMAGVRVSRLTYSWVEEYVRNHKVVTNLAPGTIRKRVGAMARVLDWHHRSTTGKAQSNPFRLLPKGYSSYSDKEAATAPAGARRDVARDRRLTLEELAAVRLALSGARRPDRERPLGGDPAFALLFELLLGTGMRLSEAYRLRRGQVDLAKGFVRVEGSKGHRGALKPRNVPLRPALRAMLAEWVNGDGLVFPFWNGTPSGRTNASSKLSARFHGLFEFAGVGDFTEHDLRHSACCDWVELRNAQGAWTFSDVEVCKIMGWSNYSMILRYASLRGEDLAARLG